MIGYMNLCYIEFIGKREDGDSMKIYPKHMKISELSAHSKVTPATIHYYVRLGLLPKPIMIGKSKAYYTANHLTLLHQIRTLKKKGLLLEAIGKIMTNKDAETHPENEKQSIHTSRRDSIITSAIELFRSKGYDLTTVGDIVGRSGVGKGTFYQYFQSKEDLFFECAESVFYDIGKDDPAIRDEKDGLIRLRNRSYSFLKCYSHMIDMLNLLRGASIEDASRLDQVFAKVMKNLIEPLHSDLKIAFAQGNLNFHDLRLLAYLVMGTGEYLTYYIQNNTGCDVEEMLSKIWKMFFGPLSILSPPMVKD